MRPKNAVSNVISMLWEMRDSVCVWTREQKTSAVRHSSIMKGNTVMKDVCLCARCAITIKRKQMAFTRRHRPTDTLSIVQCVLLLRTSFVRVASSREHGAFPTTAPIQSDTVLAGSLGLRYKRKSFPMHCKCHSWDRPHNPSPSPPLYGTKNCAIISVWRRSRSVRQFVCSVCTLSLSETARIHTHTHANIRVRNVRR